MGPGRTPTVHRCPACWGDLRWLTTTKTDTTSVTSNTCCSDIFLKHFYSSHFVHFSFFFTFFHFCILITFCYFTFFCLPLYVLSSLQFFLFHHFIFFHIFDFLIFFDFLTLYMLTFWHVHLPFFPVCPANSFYLSHPFYLFLPFTFSLLSLTYYVFQKRNSTFFCFCLLPFVKLTIFQTLFTSFTSFTSVCHVYLFLHSTV